MALHSVIPKLCTIASGASLSDAINVQGYDVVSIQQAASCEGTAYTFQGSVDGVTFNDIYDNAGAEWSVTKSATIAQCHQLAAKQLQGLVAIKVRTGTSGSPTTQSTTAQIIVVGLRAVVDSP